jgi:hypothetical protein
MRSQKATGFWQIKIPQAAFCHTKSHIWSFVPQSPSVTGNDGAKEEGEEGGGGTNKIGEGVYVPA